MTDSLSLYAQGKIDQLAAASLLRTLRPTHRLEGVEVVRDGRRFVSFSCNDYLGLSHHPEVKAAAQAAIETYGVGAGASRLVTRVRRSCEASSVASLARAKASRLSIGKGA